MFNRILGHEVEAASGFLGVLHGERPLRRGAGIRGQPVGQLFGAGAGLELHRAFAGFHFKRALITLAMRFHLDLLAVLLEDELAFLRVGEIHGHGLARFFVAHGDGAFVFVGGNDIHVGIRRGEHPGHRQGGIFL